MHQITPIKIIVTPVLLCCLLSACSPSNPEEVLARFDGGTITRQELKLYMKSPAKPQFREDGKSAESVGIEELIRRFAALKILASTVDISETDGADQPFLFLDSTTRGLLDFYIGTVGKVTVEISDEDALKRYEALKSTRFTLPEKAKLQYIFLRRDRHTRGEIDSLLEMMAGELKQGTTFDDLVTRYSESDTKNRNGIFGPVFRGKMEPDFEEQLFAHAGENAPFRATTRDGVFLIRILEYTPSRIMPFEEVRSGVIQNLVDQQTAKQREELMAEIREKHEVISDPDDGDQDGLVLKIDDRTLDVDSLNRYIASTQAPDSKGETDRETAIEQLIDLNLMVLDATDRGLDRDPEFLARRNFHELQRRADIARKQLHLEWVETIPDEEIEDAFREDPTRYTRPGSYELEWVFVPFTLKAPFARLELAESLKIEMESGKSGEQLKVLAETYGAQYRDPGEISAERALRLGPEASRALKNLEAGEVSNAIQIKQGFIVLHLKAETPRHAMQLPEDAEAIRQHYCGIHRKEILKQINQRLLEEHHLKIFSTDFASVSTGGGPGAS